MKNMNTLKRIMAFAFMLVPFITFSQVFTFENAKMEPGIHLKSAGENNVTIEFSIQEFSMDKIIVNGEIIDKILMPGSFLPAEEGTPDLPSIGRYIAIPQGAQAVLKVKSYTTKRYTEVEVSPAPRIPAVSDDNPLHYEKNPEIFNKNAFYPEAPFNLSAPIKIRGVDAVILGLSPFQYNPITKELIVYSEVELEVVFNGGNAQFGDNRLRSRFWEPILEDVLLNYASLPAIDFFPENLPESKNTNFEYIIITPDDPQFIMWADSIRRFRSAQGIRTGVFQLQQIGGNNAGAIESFVNNAYNTWQIPPAAVLLMADYGNSGNTTITSPMHDNYCVSDNIYADVDGDNLPEISFARMTAQNAGHLETMIHKFINYETDPPTNPDFYNHPITAGGWQTERWFILCTEVCHGFWTNELNKEPVREYAIYSGTPGSSWSTGTNTSTVVSYFGPSGLGYIPADPSYLTDWGGNASRINTDINAGAFMLLHRDHGYENGWGEPAYSSSDIAGLNNEDLTFVLSLNCLTGKYNMAGTCFAEAFHRHATGCTGIIAASETSYSFVNDAYCWGMFDHMWGNFDPGYGVPPVASDWVRPCFANASGKFYLASSNWPSNTNNKVVTYHLFHHHGDAFQTVYYEIPQNLTVTHPEEITPGTLSMSVTANNGSTVCLSSNGAILDVEQSSGGAVTLNFVEAPVGSLLTLTVTKQNYYRYEALIPVVGPPAAATSPSPANNQSMVSIFTGLAWNGSGADYYEVYFGTDNPPSNLLNGLQVTETTYTFSEPLSFAETYYWQVVAVNNYGSAGSEVWSFTAAGEPDEDFETGDFSLHSWNMSGDAEWQVVGNAAKHGSYSAQSGTISNGQTSAMAITIDCSGFEKIKFYKKVSSEEGSDPLQLFIDGILKAEWSGEIDWSYEQFSSGPGPHTFEWRYTKDANGSGGEDKAWIDFIYFPPTAALAANAGNDTEICEGNAYTTTGFASNHTSVEWSTAGDGTFEDVYALNTLYTPGNNDINNGSVILTLTAFSGTDQISDDVLITINRAVQTEIGEGNICEQGTVIDWISAFNFASAEWSSAGDGAFDDPTLLNAIYTPGPADVANGSVTLTLMLTAFNGCADFSETVTIPVLQIAQIPAMPEGPDAVDVFYTPETVYITSGDADTYEWSLTPVSAGTFASNDQQVTIQWNQEFQGNAELKVRGINPCGISAFSEALVIVVDNSVGIDPFTTGIAIHPNPSNGHFTVTWSPGVKETAEVKITSANGALVTAKEVTVNGTTTLSFDRGLFSQGIYYLTITAKNGTYLKKIVIQ
ncbi:MAG TPA: C25 family cysteine peptidase [Bacteroidales bacterium]|nr:C25 family cysteine peptidase [Bacteroidales bacterium]